MLHVTNIYLNQPSVS